MTSNEIGNRGEAEVLNFFVSEGFEVYTPFGTASKCDMIVLKDKIAQRVSVKTCSGEKTYRGYLVKIRQSQKGKQIPFDNTSCDLLAVYIMKEDKVYVFDAKIITNKFEIAI